MTEAQQFWDDLVQAEKLTGLDAAVDEQIRQICHCTGEVDTVELRREEYLNQIEKAAQIGRRSGFNEGWAQASVKARDAGIQFAHERICMEKTIRRLWWTAAIAAVVSALSALLWIVTH